MMPIEVATILLLYLKILLHQWLFDDWQAITVAVPNINYHLKKSQLFIEFPFICISNLKLV